MANICFICRSDMSQLLYSHSAGAMHSFCRNCTLWDSAWEAIQWAVATVKINSSDERHVWLWYCCQNEFLGVEVSLACSVGWEPSQVSTGYSKRVCQPVQIRIITARMMSFWKIQGGCARQCLLTWQLEVPKSRICLMNYAFVATDY